MRRHRGGTSRDQTLVPLHLAVRESCPPRDGTGLLGHQFGSGWVMGQCCESLTQFFDPVSIIANFLHKAIIPPHYHYITANQYRTHPKNNIVHCDCNINAITVGSLRHMEDCVLDSTNSYPLARQLACIFDHNYKR